jgi:glyoxylase-like metal-dependent hydrolase (beta-lactamase superfamily II)
LKIKKILEDIYFFGGSHHSSNTYLLEKQGIIIDPGSSLRGRIKKFLNVLNKVGVSPSRLKYIFLTHSHPDHSQGVKQFVSNYQLKVFAHPLAKIILESKNPFLSLVEREIKETGKYFKELMGVLDYHIIVLISSLVYGKFEPTKVDFTFEVGKILFDDREIEIFFPKAHSVDDVCFYLPKEGIIISGDLFDPHRGNPYSPILITPTADLNFYEKAVDKIIEFKPKYLLPGHGFPIFGEREIYNYLSKVKETIERYKEKTLEILNKNPEASFYEIGKNLEKRKDVSANVLNAYSTLSILGFVVMKALKRPR